MTPPKCYQCGSPLIFVSEKTEKGDGLFPVTSVIYKCSDPTCQREIDKKTSDRKKLFKKREKDAIERKSHPVKRKITS